jgi:hypothetical protein
MQFDLGLREVVFQDAVPWCYFILITVQYV